MPYLYCKHVLAELLALCITFTPHHTTPKAIGIAVTVKVLARINFAMHYMKVTLQYLNVTILGARWSMMRYGSDMAVLVVEQLC